MKKNEVFTVENAKVANVEYHIYKPFRDGYIKDAEGIVFVKVISILFDLKKQTFVSTLQDKEGKQYFRNGEYNLFKDKESYEVGCCKSKDATNTASLIRHIDWKRLGDCNWIRTDEKTDDSPEYGYIQVWRFENGGPIATPIVVNSIICELPDKTELNDGSIPEKYWWCMEEAFSYNEYKITDEEGVEYTEKGVNLRLMPTKEQSEILEELKAAYKKAIDAGLRFVWDRDDCQNVKAYNRTEVREIEYYDNAASYQGGNVVEINSVALADTGISFYDYNSSDEHDFVMLPTERQEKEWLNEHPEHSEE